MTNLTAKVVADSVSTNGKRITTFELEFHRFLLPEFNTHRMISKNAASSRAIPVEKMIEHVRNNSAIPQYWGKNQAGMSAKEEVTGWKRTLAVKTWIFASRVACRLALVMHKLGMHKQIANRITEPFQMIKVVATATEWDNFFWLRNHADAQPEIKMLAEKMLEALAASEPVVLTPEDWHMPYFGGGYWLKDCGIPLEDALAISSSCCAQVSYRKTDDSLEKALLVYKRLVESTPVHASPFEHCATPMPDGADFSTDGVTANHKVIGFMSGNLAGWVQFRQLIPNNTCWNIKELNKE